MRKILTTVSALIILALLTPPVAWTQSVGVDLLNKDFESWSVDDVTSWGENEPVGGIARELSTVLSGTYSVRMTLNSVEEGPNILYQDVAVWPNDSTEFSVYLRNGNASDLTMSLQYYSEGTPTGDPVEYYVEITGGFWSQHSISGAAPSDADAVRFAIRQDYNEIAGRTQNVFLDIADFAITSYTCDVSTVDQWYFLGIPADVDLALMRNADSLFADDLGGVSNPSTWVMSRWNNATGLYDRFGMGDNDPDTEPPDIAPGLGYWLIQDVEPGVPNPMLDVLKAQASNGAPQEDVAQTIEGYQNGASGKTMLANPYYGVYQVNTSTITVGGSGSGWGQDGINGNIYTWNGSQYLVQDATAAATELDPWQGFWTVKTTTGNANITFVYDDAYHGAAIQSLDDEEPRYFWYVDLAVETMDGENIDHYNRLGIREGCIDEYDGWDAFEFTPPLSQYVNLSFPHFEWETPGRFAWDLRDFNSFWEYWVMEIRVHHLPNQMFEITWSNLENLPPVARLKLIELVDNQPHVVGYLDELDSYVFSSGDANDESVWLALRLVRVQDPATRTSVTQDNDMRPDRFWMTNPGPNPFNSQTAVRFNIPETGIVTLSVFDILGKEVGRLRNGTLTPGTHTFSWDAAGLASGVYLLQVNWREQQLARKVVLVK